MGLKSLFISRSTCPAEHVGTANNELVVYKGITSEPADFVLYDMYGKMQITAILEKDKAETSISLGNLNSGAYIYVINQQETKLHQGRLIVIK